MHYNIFGNRGTSLENQSQVTTAMGMGNILSNIATINHAANNVGSQTVDGKINYKRMFDKKDQELDVSINSNNGTNHGKASNYQSLLPQDSIY